MSDKALQIQERPDPAKTYRVEVPVWLALRKNVPAVFVGRVLADSGKGLQIYGRGTTDGHAVCMRCGRALTHPVSVLLGIGPECGEHWWELGRAMTEADLEYLQSRVREIMVEGWFPARFLSLYETTETVEIPAGMKAAEAKKPEDAKKWAGLVDGKIAVKFWFPKGDNRFSDALAIVKGIPGRRWKPENKTWVAPFSVEAYEALEQDGFEMGDSLQDAYARVAGEVAQGEDLGDADLDGRLRPFQKDGVLFTRDRGYRALIADEMGLGKTAQALAAMKMADEWPAVAVVPATVKINWMREAAMWVPGLRVHILAGRKNGGLPPADLYIINYDILGARLEELKAVGIKFVVLDECHFVKNKAAQRTKAVKALCKGVEKVVALSGTPITNRPVEFFTALNLIRPEAFPSFWRYAQEYCGAKHNGFGWDFTGATNLEKLHEMLTRTVMVRRLKADVLKELPPKTRAVVSLEIEDRKGYERLEMELREWVRENRNANAEALSRIEQLKQAAFARKEKAALSWIKDFLDSDQKLVVFCTHTATVDAVMSAFPGVSVRVDGRDSQNARQTSVDRFQEDDSVRLFVGNIKAAGVGITLTASSNTCFLELSWAPSDHDQAEDRVHRIGQDDAVTAWYLLADGTIESEISKLLDSKRSVLSQALDGKEADSGSMLRELMDGLAGE